MGVQQQRFGSLSKYSRTSSLTGSSTIDRIRNSMRHVYSLEEANLTAPSVVAIGAFDGVHRGHQMLIGEMIRYAQANQLVPVVLTFFPHPEMVLRGHQPGFY